MSTRSTSLALLSLALVGAVWAVLTPRAAPRDEVRLPEPFVERPAPRPLEHVDPQPALEVSEPEPAGRDASFRWIDGRELNGFEPGGCVLPRFDLPDPSRPRARPFPRRPIHR